METAISFKSGKHVHASDCSYQSYLALRLHCPECGEPVFFKRRQVPNNLAFFSHHEKKKTATECSLRTEGVPIGIASRVVRGLKHGQLVDRFQKEYLTEIKLSLGEFSDTLINFITESQFEKLERAVYLDFLQAIQKNLPYVRILMISPEDFNKEKIDEVANDFVLFLKSPYGNWVGNFIYQTAYFIAVTLREEHVNLSTGRYFFADKDETVIFPLDPSRLNKTKKYAGEILDAEDPRNVCIDRISSVLLNYLIFRWRYPDLLPKLTSKSLSKKTERYSGYARDELPFPKSRVKYSSSPQEIVNKKQSEETRTPHLNPAKRDPQNSPIPFFKPATIDKNAISWKANSKQHAEVIVKALLRDRGKKSKIKIIGGDYWVEIVE